MASGANNDVLDTLSSLRESRFIPLYVVERKLASIWDIIPSHYCWQLISPLDYTSQWII